MARLLLGLPPSSLPSCVNNRTGYRIETCRLDRVNCLCVNSHNRSKSNHDPSSFKASLYSNGHRTTPSSNSKDPIPSAHHRKGKRRQDIHLAKNLWNNGGPLCPRASWRWISQRRTWSTFLSASLISSPTRLLDLTRQWMLVIIALLFGCI